MSAALLTLICHEQPDSNIWLVVIDSGWSRVTGHWTSRYLFSTSFMHPSMKYTMESTNYTSLPIKHYFTTCAEPLSSEAAKLQKQHAND